MENIQYKEGENWKSDCNLIELNINEEKYIYIFHGCNYVWCDLNYWSKVDRCAELKVWAQSTISVLTHLFIKSVVLYR